MKEKNSILKFVAIVKKRYYFYFRNNPKRTIKLHLWDKSETRFQDNLNRSKFPLWSHIGDINYFRIRIKEHSQFSLPQETAVLSHYQYFLTN